MILLMGSILALKSPYQKLFFLLILLMSLASSIFVALEFEKEGRFRGHYSGDGSSNSDVLRAGKNFDEVGFLRLRLAPVQEGGLRPESVANLKPADFYTHYPAGSDLFQGLLFRLGLETHLSHQLVSIFISFVGAVFAWLVLSQIFSVQAALVAYAFTLLVPSFFFFADSLHGYTWFSFLNWFYFYRILQLFKTPDHWKRFAFEFFFLGLFASWLSIDPIPLFLAFGIMIPFGLSQKIVLKRGIFLMMAAVFGELVGFTLHIVRNAFVLGGLHAAFSDMFHAFLLRAGDTAVLKDSAHPYSAIKHVVKYFLGIQWFFTLPALAIAAVGWILALKKTTQRRFWIGTFIASSLGGLFWQFFMRQHSMVHAFTYRHLGIFIILGMGLFYEMTKSKRARRVIQLSVGYLAIHSVLALANWEGAGVKRYFINALVPPENFATWACNQNQRLAGTIELQGAKEIVGSVELSKCESIGLNSAVPGIKSRIAEVILYWR